MELPEGHRKIHELFEECLSRHQSVYQDSSIDFTELNLTKRMNYKREPIGGGHYSDVYKDTLFDATVVAVKVFRLPAYCQRTDGLYKTTLLRFFRELHNWAELRHDHVARMLGYTLDCDKIGLVSLWYSHGNLVDYLHQADNPSKPDLMLDIAEGLRYLHSLAGPLVHGDVKGVNVFINQHGIAHLGDFGISKQMGDLQRQTGFTTNSGACGTTPWMAPELFKDNLPTLESDMYSFGGVLLEVWCPGSRPFDYLNQWEIPNIKMQGKVPDRKRYPGMKEPGWLWPLMKLCWKPDPSARLNALDAVDLLYSNFKLSPRAGELVTPRSPGVSYRPSGTIVENARILSSGSIGRYFKTNFRRSNIFSKRDDKARGVASAGPPSSLYQLLFGGKGAARTPSQATTDDLTDQPSIPNHHGSPIDAPGEPNRVRPVSQPDPVAGSHNDAERKPPTTDFVTVFPIQIEPNFPLAGYDMDLQALRKKCPRFRILVIGKANAGKTTILQKMCNTTEAPVIHDRLGRVVDPSAITPSDGRVIHNISNELTFSGNPAFVFHDSPGFEAASTQELVDVREFIANRAAANTLKDQLHVIWYCLPTDSARPLSDAEMSFFECGTGRVPVIAIFTKYDGMILKEYNKLRFELGYLKSEANRLAPQCANDLFLHSGYFLKRVQDTPYPPVICLRTQSMQKPGSECADLNKQTLEALDGKRLQLLFVSVQQNNLQFCTACAIKESILPALAKSYVDLISLKKMTKGALSYYGHLDEFYPLLDLQFSQKIVSVLASIIPTLGGQGPITLQILRSGVAVLIIAEDSFWLKERGHSSQKALKLALDDYLASGRHSVVIRKVNEAFGGLEGLDENKEEELVRVMGEIVKEFSSTLKQI